MRNSIDVEKNAKNLPNELLQMYRKRAGLTQSDLAKLIGLQSKRMVQSWEAGETLPRSERLQRLIEFYLQRQVFLPNQELKEARHFWNCIKDFFDATNRGMSTYPIFDLPWFENLLKHQGQLAVSPPTVSNILKIVSSDPTPVPHNLPSKSGPLFGRERELVTLERLLQADNSRLVTLYGPGGTGKTLLALYLAYQFVLEPNFADGLYWVDLTSLRDPQLLVSAIAQVLALKETKTSSLLDRLKQYLAERRLLLVLDNFEQIVEAAPTLAELLSHCDNLKIVVTSRAVLRIYGEQVYPVFPLELPSIKPSITFEQLKTAPAIQLFVAQAKRVLPNFMLTSENAGVIAQICTRLDGLPLALELAAARIKLFTPQALLKRLDHRFDLLVGGPNDRPWRHQTLQAALDWSYELLSPSEKRLFRRLAVFTGGITLSAAEKISIIEGEPATDTIKNFESLLDKSLLQTRPASQPISGELEPRFGMLETLREYGLKRLAESGEATHAFSQFATCFLNLAEEAEPKIREEDQAVWLDLLEAEIVNLRAALTWLLETQAIVEALKLAGALWWFWNVRGDLGEGVRWLKQSLELSEGLEVEVTLRAKARHGLAVLLCNLGEYDQALVLMKQVLAVRRELGDKQAVSVCLHNLGVINHNQGNYAEAVQIHQESLQLKRELGYQWGIAHSLDELGTIAGLQGDYHKARKLLGESLELFVQLGDKYSLACAISNLGRIMLFQTSYSEAQALFEQGLQLAHKLANRELIGELSNYQGLLKLYQGQAEAALDIFEQTLNLFEDVQQPQGLSLSLTYLGLAYWQVGQLEEASRLLIQGLRLRQKLGMKEGLAWNLEGLAFIAFEENQPGRAVQFFAAAATLRSQIGAALPLPNRKWSESFLSKVSQQLDPASFELAWQTGQQMPVEQLSMFGL